MIMRGENVVVPDGNASIKKGDRVIVVSAEHRITRLSDIFVKWVKES